MKLFLLLFLLINSVQAIVIPEQDDKGRSVTRTAGVTSDSNTRVRYIGTHDFSIAGNQTVSSDWVVPQQTYQGSNKDTIISGVQFKVVDGCDGDKVSFQIVHPQAGVVDEFATDFYLFKDELFMIKEHRANLPTSLIVRVVYKSTCATAARFIMNLLRYMETN